MRSEMIVFRKHPSVREEDVLAFGMIDVQRIVTKEWLLITEPIQETIESIL